MNYKYENLSTKRMLNIIENNKMCILGMNGKETPYMLPINYESDYRDHTLVISMKSKNYGMKIRLLNDSNNVCLYFDNKNNNYIETVVAFGKLYMDKSSKNKKESNINIVIEKLNGRKYLCEQNYKIVNQSRLFRYK